MIDIQYKILKRASYGEKIRKVDRSFNEKMVIPTYKQLFSSSYLLTIARYLWLRKYPLKPIIYKWSESLILCRTDVISKFLIFFSVTIFLI